MSQKKSTNGLLHVITPAKRSLRLLNKTVETECKSSIVSRESYMGDCPNTSNCNFVRLTVHSDVSNTNTKIISTEDKRVSYSNCDINVEVDSDHAVRFESNGCMEKVSQIKLDNNISESVDGDMVDCGKKNMIDQEVREEETKNIYFSGDKMNRDESVASSTTNQVKKYINNSGNVHQALKNNEIECKIDELLCNMTCSSDTDDELNQNSFIETMAEKGEEDTPSEGSNDFMELGEQINTTESELSANDSYENNSFIDDSENGNCKLLPGKEYDLEIYDDRKRRRIVKLSSGSDVSIVRLNKSKKKNKKMKQSRIIRFEDSSDEQPSDVVTQMGLLHEKDNRSNDRMNHIHDTIDFKEIDKTYNDSNFILKEATNELMLGKTKNDITRQQLLFSHKENNATDKKTVESSRIGYRNVENSKKKIVILENIKLQDVYNKGLSEPVSTVICSGKSIQHKHTAKYQRVVSPLKSTTINTTEIMRSSSEVNIKENKKKNMKSKRKQRNGEQKFNNYSNNVQSIFRESTLDREFKFEAANSTSNDRKIIKKRKHWDYFTSPSKSNILDEAIFHDMEKQLCLGSDLLSKKYKMGSGTNKKSEKTIVKSMLEEKLKANQFHIKDFKGLMLYNNERIKRMETWKLLKKKI